MSIAKLNERELLGMGMSGPTVSALRHILAQTGNQFGAQTLPFVATQAALVPALVVKTNVLDLHAALLADAVASNSAADVPIVSLPVNGALKAGMTLSGRIVGTTSNGATPGTLNLWLSVAGVKVITHAFTTPDIAGAGKGFAADFTLTLRTASTAAAGGVLSLAYNAPTVLPASATFTVPTGINTVFALGMNWLEAKLDNIATAKVAYLTVDKL